MNSYIQPHRFSPILSSSDQQQIKSYLYSLNTAWTIANSTVSNKFIPEYNFDERVMDTFNCVHIIEPTSPIYSICMSLAERVCKELSLSIKVINRIKANTLLSEQGFTPQHFNVPHRDHDIENALSLIYYVDNSDGDTCIFTEFDAESKALGTPQRYKPVQGSAVVFNSNVYHASSNPVNSRRRTVINIVLEYGKQHNDTFDISS